MYLYAWFPVLPSGSGGVGRGGWGGEDWQRPFGSVHRPGSMKWLALLCSACRAGTDTCYIIFYSFDIIQRIYIYKYIYIYIYAYMCVIYCIFSLVYHTLYIIYATLVIQYTYEILYVIYQVF